MGEAPGTDYFRWFYDTGVWKRMHYRGVRILKVPSDLWSYQEIFIEHRVDWVLETGTRHGGSALYFADLLQLNGARGKVISVDVDRGRRCQVMPANAEQRARSVQAEREQHAEQQTTLVARWREGRSGARRGLHEHELPCRLPPRTIVKSGFRAASAGRPSTPTIGSSHRRACSTPSSATTWRTC